MTTASGKKKVSIQGREALGKLPKNVTKASLGEMALALKGLETLRDKVNKFKLFVTTGKLEEKASIVMRPALLTLLDSYDRVKSGKRMTEATKKAYTTARRTVSRVVSALEKEAAHEEEERLAFLKQVVEETAKTGDDSPFAKIEAMQELQASNPRETWGQKTQTSMKTIESILHSFDSARSKVKTSLKKKEEFVLFRAPILVIMDKVIMDTVWKRAGINATFLPSGSEHVNSSYILSDQLILGIPKTLDKKQEKALLDTVLIGVKRQTGEAHVNALGEHGNTALESGEGGRPFFAVRNSRLFYTWLVPSHAFSIIGNPPITRIGFPFEFSPNELPKQEGKPDLKTLREEAEKEIKRRTDADLSKLRQAEQDQEKTKDEMLQIDPQQFYRRVAVPRRELNGSAIGLFLRAAIGRNTRKPEVQAKEVAAYFKVSENVSNSIISEFKTMGQKLDQAKVKKIRALYDQSLTLKRQIDALNATMESIRETVYSEFRKQHLGAKK